MTTHTFNSEFTNLIKFGLEVARTDANGLADPVRKYKTRFDNESPDDHRKYCRRLYDIVGFEVTNETEMGKWLVRGDHRIVYRKGEKGAYIPLSDIYRLALKNMEKYDNTKIEYMYPKIILLHLYRVFKLISESETDTSVLERKIDLLSGDLSGRSSQQMMVLPSANIIENVINAVNPMFGGMIPKEAISAIGGMVTNPEAKKAIGEMNELVTEGPNIAMKAMEELKKSQSDNQDGMTTVKNVVEAVLATPAIDNIRPFAALMIKEAKKYGVIGDLPAGLLDDIDKQPVSETFRKIMNAPETQAEMQSLQNIKMGDYDVVGMGAKLLSQFMPVDPSVNKQPTIEELQSFMKTLPPDQVKALLSNFTG